MFLSLEAGAQQKPGVNPDDPIPYGDESPDDSGEPRKLPRRSDRTTGAFRETDPERADRDVLMAAYDDPNFGFGAELLAGLMLLDSSRGALVEPAFGYGLRATWEWSRLMSDELLRESFFADVTWSYSAQRAGTTDVYGDSNYHYFSLAPAYAFPLGRGSSFALFGQLGAGAVFQHSVLHVADVETRISGVKPLFQYGIGFRGRPAINLDQSVRLSFRVEFTRFRRAYMDDTFLGGSVGFVF